MNTPEEVKATQRAARRRLTAMSLEIERSSPSATTPDEPTSRPADAKGQEPA